MAVDASELVTVERKEGEGVTVSRVVTLSRAKEMAADGWSIRPETNSPIEMGSAPAAHFWNPDQRRLDEITGVKNFQRPRTKKELCRQLERECMEKWGKTVEFEP